MPSQLKIAIVTEYYYPTLGGIQEHVHHFARELIRRGHEVLVITSRIRDIRDDPAREHGVPVVRLGTGVRVGWNGSTGRMSFGLSLGSKLERILACERFDVIHLHAPIQPTLPLLALLRSHQPAGGITVGTFHTNFSAGRLLRLLRPVCQRALDRLDGCIAVSRTASAAISRFLDVHPRVIPNGIDTGLFHPAAPGLPEFCDGRVNLLWLGRIETRNGLDRMIRAFALACETRSDLRLIVAGDGPLRARCQAMVPVRLRDRVCFQGYVNTARPALLASAQVLCVPATISSFGITLLEGMASGKPVIASDIDGFRDVLRHGREGWLVDTSDPRSFAAAILRFAADENLRAAFGAQGRWTALRYAWPRVTDQILAFYQEIAAGKREERACRCG